MRMLDHVRNLKSMDCFTQSGDVASDSGGVFLSKQCEFGTYANQSCGPRSFHECCKSVFSILFGGKEEPYMLMFSYMFYLH